MKDELSQILHLLRMAERWANSSKRSFALIERTNGELDVVSAVNVDKTWVKRVLEVVHG